MQYSTKAKRECTCNLKTSKVYICEDCIQVGPDDRTVDYEKIAREREQKILRGY